MRAAPMGTVLRGATAGALGTIGMDLLLYSRYRRDGGSDRFSAWELAAGTESWDEAPTPGLVGRRVARDVLHRDPPDSAAALTTNVVHWATGCQWGAAYGLLAAATGRPGVRSGAVLGLVACSTSYAVLPLLGLYKPIWEYEAATLAKDYRAHLVFGTVTGVAFWALARS
ncbi:MAG: hypothetical protein ABIS47_04500 [Acidimicrobiales bacterium]